MDLVVQHHRRDRLCVADQIFPHDHNCDAGRAHVLLCAGVDDPKLRDIHGFGAEVGRHVGDQDGIFVGGRGVVLEFDAVDRLVGADVEVSSVRRLLDLVEGGDGGVFVGFSRPDQVGFRVFGGFFVGLVAPRSGDDVVDGGVGRGAEVEGDGGELGGGAALEEEDGVVVGDGEEAAEVGLGLLDDGVELFASVRHLHDAHAGGSEVEEVGLGLEDDGFWEGGGAGCEVEYGAAVGAGGGGGG